MPAAEFTITIEDGDHDDYPRAVQVMVYDTVKGMRIAASHYANRHGGSQAANGEVPLGLCHRFQLIYPDGQPHPICALVRLARPHLGVGIVSHELAHAAVWINELDTEPDEPVLKNDNDERFCWTLGELVRQTTTQLYAHGYYD